MQIGRIDPADGTITAFPLDPGSEPTGITAGEDGALWFTMRGTGELGRITTTGVVTEFDADLDSEDTLNDIAAGPDGKLWFTVESEGTTTTSAAARTARRSAASIPTTPTTSSTSTAA